MLQVIWLSLKWTKLSGRTRRRDTSVDRSYCLELVWWCFSEASRWGSSCEGWDRVKEALLKCGESRKGRFRKRAEACRGCWL